MVQTVSPFLWFDTGALEAAQFYTSLFDDSAVDSVTHYGPGAPMPAGSVMTVSFHIEGLELQAINGGPQFPFTEAISLWVKAPTQERIDYLWEQLTADGGAPGPCGWLKDRWGLSWQVVPPRLVELLGDSDSARVARVTAEMMSQSKLDIAALEAAYAG